MQNIELSENYFKNLLQILPTELTILPVKMEGTGFWSLFFSMDYNLQSSINAIAYRWNRAFTCSGANLLFKKDFFMKAMAIRKDEKIQWR